MAKTAMKIKQQRKQKFSTREYTRCNICGRPHSVLRKYGICIICLREIAYNGQNPGGYNASREEPVLNKINDRLIYQSDHMSKRDL